MDLLEKIKELETILADFKAKHEKLGDRSEFHAFAAKIPAIEKAINKLKAKKYPDKTGKKTVNPVLSDSISGSVGAKGVNKEADVELIQKLLNDVGLKPKLSVDGDCGPKTIAAITAYQKRLGFRKPDGRIDVGGTTWKKLSANITASDTSVSEDSSANNTSNSTDGSDSMLQGVIDHVSDAVSGVVDYVSDMFAGFNTPEAEELKANSKILKSVGTKGVNDAADVLTVQKLLKEVWNYNIPTDGKLDDKTTQAIRQFQYRYAGMIKKQDETVDPGGNTWKYLTGKLKPEFGYSKDGVIGGAETEEEKKMAEFTKAFSGIQIEVGAGEIVTVRPPYHINLGHRLAKAKEARKANPKVAKIISKLGYGGSVGKATPSQIEKFLEECLKQNLIKDKTSKGLHDFLAKYGISTDCSGLAIQAVNFLVQGDMERSTSGQDSEAVEITNTAGIQRRKEVSAPSALKAGDMMVNYKRKGTSTYHVRVIIDVDTTTEGTIQFTTVESSADSTLGDGGNGVGQRRWEFPDPTKFGNLKILKGNEWATAGKSDQAYTYTRFNELA